MPHPPFDEDQLRAIVEEASDGIFVTDARLSIEWANARSCEMLGRSLPELVGMPIAKLLVPGHPLNETPLQLEELRSGRRTLTRRAMQRPDGEVRILEVAAQMTSGQRVMGIARDLTEPLRDQARLERSEASFRAVIEALPDGVVVHRGGRVVYANPALAALFGIDRAELAIGASVLEFVHPADRANAAQRVSALSAGAPTQPFVDERLITRDGRVVRCSIGGVRVQFEGEPSVLTVVRDVTAQRRMEAQLAQADRLSSLGSLAAGVAHEINNPLTYVVLHLEAIESLARRASREPSFRDRALSDVAHHAASASEGADRVRRIVRDLRVFSRADDEEAGRTLDVRTALDVALSTAWHEVKHRARLVRELAPVPPVVASEGRLAQVFLNLVLNAAQAIPDGAPDRHAIVVRTESSGDDVRISVSDTGTGIAPEHMPRLFDPFFTTKEVGEGSGLGLAICHGIVSALGGRIEVQSTLGHGATFTVVLPRGTGREPAPDESSRPRDGERSASARLRLLVIDDEPGILRVLRMGLGIRHEVVTAESGSDAIALLREDDRYDVILCDVLMPDMSGAHVHEWVRRERPALEPRILFMSGGRTGEAAHDLPERARDRWVEKPFVLARLEERILELAQR